MSKAYVKSNVAGKIDNLINSVDAIAKTAVSRVTPSQNRPFEMSFDEIETVKFAKAKNGMIVFSVGDKNDFEIQEMLNAEAQVALNKITADMAAGMKEALNGRLIR